MNKLYSVSGISKQGYYKRIKLENKKNNILTRIEEMVKLVRIDHSIMGIRKIFYKLKIKEIGINRFERYASELGLGIQIKRNLIRTTNSNHYYKKYPNLINGIILQDINQLWSSDITYFITKEKVYYIVLIQDVYSRRILGYSASENMFATNNIKALKQSLKTRVLQKILGLIHHSDKGSQYGCNEYIELLNNAGIKISMANNSLENPYAERLNGIIKNEYLVFKNIESLKDLTKELNRAVWLYNNERPHMELNYLTPIEFEKYILKEGKDNKPEMILYNFIKKAQ